MALARLELKVISRGKGASAIAKAAYISGSQLRSADHGDFDYRKKAGVSLSVLLPAPGLAVPERGTFWHAQEAAEKRKDACVAREFTMTLPRELSNSERIALAYEFATAVRDRYDLAAVDLALHDPPRSRRKSGAKLSLENPHAHLLFPTRDRWGKKTRILDSKKTGSEEVKALRALWQSLVNRALAAGGYGVRVDLKNLQDQLIEAEARVAALEEELIREKAMYHAEKESFNKIKGNENGRREQKNAENGQGRSCEGRGGDTHVYDRERKEKAGSLGVKRMADAHDVAEERSWTSLMRGQTTGRKIECAYSGLPGSGEMAGGRLERDIFWPSGTFGRDAGAEKERGAGRTECSNPRVDMASGENRKKNLLNITTAIKRKIAILVELEDRKLVAYGSLRIASLLLKKIMALIESKDMETVKWKHHMLRKSPVSRPHGWPPMKKG